jgi:stringent starvation protein B
MSIPPNNQANITVGYDQYLIYGIVAWIESNQYKPLVIVDTRHEGVKLPSHCMAKPVEYINMRSGAMANVQWGETAVSFNTRFSGQDFRLTIPYKAMLCFIFHGTDTRVALPWTQSLQTEMMERAERPTPPQPVPELEEAPQVSEEALPSNVTRLSFGRPKVNQ